MCVLAMAVSGLTSEMSRVACNMHIILKAVATSVALGTKKKGGGARQLLLLATCNPLKRHKMGIPKLSIVSLDVHTSILIWLCIFWFPKSKYTINDTPPPRAASRPTFLSPRSLGMETRHPDGYFTMIFILTCRRMF